MNLTLTTLENEGPYSTMKTSQILLTVFCIVVAILSMCQCTPQWRPQGRFGKRTDHLAVSDESSVPYFGFFNKREFPVEALFSKKELRNGAFRPILCSTSGLTGYPPCESTAIETRDLESILAKAEI